MHTKLSILPLAKGAPLRVSDKVKNLLLSVDSVDEGSDPDSIRPRGQSPVQQAALRET